MLVKNCTSCDHAPVCRLRLRPDDPLVVCLASLEGQAIAEILALSIELSTHCHYYAPARNLVPSAD